MDDEYQMTTYNVNKYTNIRVDGRKMKIIYCHYLIIIIIATTIGTIHCIEELKDFGKIHECFDC